MLFRLWTQVGPRNYILSIDVKKTFIQKNVKNVKKHDKKTFVNVIKNVTCS